MGSGPAAVTTRVRLPRVRPGRVRSARRAARGALGLALLCAFGCAVNPVTGRREIILMSPERETQLGKEAARAVEREIGLVEDPRLVGYVAAIGARVAAQSPRRDVPYAFHVADMPESNAFALPGGYVYVSRGLLALANSEDEVANVLAHEIAHVAARHSAQRETRAVGVGILSALGTLAAAALGGAGAAQATAQIGQVAGAGLIASYGRDQEREADHFGQEFAARAGWDPAAMARFLRSLEGETRLRLGGSRRPSFLDSHPSTPERMEAAAARAASLSRRSVAPVAPTRAAFCSRLEGLLLGPDPAQGVVRGEEFLHPDLDFRLRFPRGWTVQNSPTDVSAVDPRREAGVGLVAQEKGSDAPGAARRFERENGIALLDPRPVRIGGAPAYHGRAILSADGRSVALDLTWIPHGGAVYRLQGLTAKERFPAYADAFRDAASSFRRLTDAERAGIRARRLHVVQAREGETLAEITARTGNVWSPQETTLMNGRGGSERLGAGEPVKIARDHPHRPGGGR